MLTGVTGYDIELDKQGQVILTLKTADGPQQFGFHPRAFRQFAAELPHSALSIMKATGDTPEGYTHRLAGHPLQGYQIWVSPLGDELDLVLLATNNLQTTYTLTTLVADALLQTLTEKIQEAASLRSPSSSTPN